MCDARNGSRGTQALMRLTLLLLVSYRPLATFACGSDLRLAIYALASEATVVGRAKLAHWRDCKRPTHLARDTGLRAVIIGAPERCQRRTQRCRPSRASAS